MCAAPHRGPLRFDVVFERFRAFTPRLALMGGAVLAGLAAIAFADIANAAQAAFGMLFAAQPLAPLLVTPLGFALVAWLTLRFSPESRGSGIPQIIAAGRNPGVAGPLTSMRTGIFKFVLTEIGLLVGASVGREGPTVQIATSVMTAMNRLFRVPVDTAIIIAGGAAGVSAAFNTPLAGVAFAIEELAAAYEQRMALVVMLAVMVSGLVSLGIAGDYLYFGAMHQSLSIAAAIVVAPTAGVLGGVCGGLFSRWVLSFSRARRRWWRVSRSHPILWAIGCGLLVAIIGIVAAGTTWGTGYTAAKALIETGNGPIWFGPAKLATTVLSTISNMPGGIFSPSLAAGAGFGRLLATLFPSQPASAVVVLGMIAYFVGVVRAPLTGVIIVAEMTDSRAMILPLFAAAIIADAASALVCRERLYHGLSHAFEPRPQKTAQAETLPDHPPEAGRPVG